MQGRFKKSEEEEKKSIPLKKIIPLKNSIPLLSIPLSRGKNDKGKDC
jgi:hypothetical protein